MDEPTDPPSRSILVASLGLVFLGVVLRFLLLRSSVGPADGDESVVLLMAKDMVAGHFETFFWGQEYGGSQEAFLVSLLARVGVPLRWGGEIVTIGLSVAASCLLWRLARSIAGDRVARLAGALYWATPILYVWLSQKERGFYGSSAVSCLAALLLATRFLRTGRIADALGLGLATGSAIWSSPQAFYLLVPLGLWLGGHLLRTRRWHLLRAAPVAGIAAIIGGAPWLWTNAHTRLQSLHRPPTPVTSPGERLSLYWRIALPQVSGFKLPYDPLRWIGTRAFLLPHLALVALALVGVVLLARRAPWVPLAAAWHPILFTALGTSFYVSEARYLFLLWPTAALALAAAAVRYGKDVGAVALALLCGLLAVVGYNGLLSFAAAHPGTFDLATPDADLVVAAMEELGVGFAYADYWSAYPLEVASNGDVVATPLYVVRDPRRERQVRTAARSAYVVHVNGCAEEALRSAATAAGQGPPERRPTAGLYVVLVPERPIPPEEVASLWAKERGTLRPDLPDCLS